MKDIMPFVEKNYRALTGRDNRVIAGLSMGGGHTWINWRRYLNELAPRLFRTAGE
jgi:enterochelin esterase-like enzyme